MSRCCSPVTVDDYSDLMTLRMFGLSAACALAMMSAVPVAQAPARSIATVLDTLDLAVQHIADADSADGKALVASGNQLHGVLSKEGLERIDPLGEVFDPNTHEAVGRVPDDDEVADDEGDRPLPKPVVAQVMRPGYRWKGAVLRPAMVTVRG